jgi:hypothetical protein
MRAHRLSALAALALSIASLTGCIVRTQPAYYYQPRPVYVRPAPRVYYTRPAVVVAQPVAQPVTTTVIYR